MKNIVAVLLVLGLLSVFAPGEDITVAAAADLNYAMQALSTQFENTTGNKVKLSFGSSGNFFSQIQGGAPYDLFFSADLEYPEKLAAAGFVDRDSFRTYAIGRLVLWVPNEVHLDPVKLKMEVLLQPAVKHVAMANPAHAPYGRAAESTLTYYGMKDKVAAKLVYGENISQAAQYVHSGNAEAGLIALSLALSPPMKAAGQYWELPSNSYPALRQGVAIVSNSKHKKVAQSFLDYVVSAPGRAILEQYGFRVADEK